MMRKLTMAACIACMFVCCMSATVHLDETAQVRHTPEATVEREEKGAPPQTFDEEAPIWLGPEDAMAKSWEPKWPTIADPDLVHLRRGREVNVALYVDGPYLHRDSKDRVIRACGVIDKTTKTPIASRINEWVTNAPMLDQEACVPMTEHAWRIGWLPWRQTLLNYVQDTGNEIVWTTEMEYEGDDDRAPSFISVWAASPSDHAETLDLRLTIRNTLKGEELDRATLEPKKNEPTPEPAPTPETAEQED